MNNSKRNHSKQGRGEYDQLKLMQNLKYGLKFARELYYSCLLVFLFYERVIFNQFFKTGLDYAILGMTCFGVFLLVSFTKHRIPLKLLFALTVIQLIIIGVLFYDIGFRLPEEYTESFLTAWAFGKGGQTSLAVLLLVSLPLSYREFANRCFLMEKLLLDKEIPLELSSPGSDYFITGIFVMVLGLIARLGYFLVPLILVVPLILSVGCISIVFNTLDKLNQFQEKPTLLISEQSLPPKIRIPVKIPNFLRFIMILAVICVFSFSTLYDEDFLFDLLFPFGGGILVFSATRYMLYSKMEFDVTKVALRLFIYGVFLASFLVLYEVLSSGVIYSMEIGIPPLIAGCGSAQIFFMIDQKLFIAEESDVPRFTMALMIPRGLVSEFSFFVLGLFVFVTSTLEVSPNGTNAVLIYLIGLVLGAFGLFFELLTFKLRRK